MQSYNIFGYVKALYENNFLTGIRNYVNINYNADNQGVVA